MPRFFQRAADACEKLRQRANDDITRIIEERRLAGTLKPEVCDAGYGALLALQRAQLKLAAFAAYIEEQK